MGAQENKYCVGFATLKYQEYKREVGLNKIITSAQTRIRSGQFCFNSECQVNPKGARNALFSTFKRFKKQTFFHNAHIGNGSALWTSLHFHVRLLNASQEPLWDRNMRPLRLPDTCPLAHTLVVVCKVSSPPVLCYASHGLWGPRCSATHASRGYSRRALLALGLRWLSCIPCPRPILQNCRHHETQNLSHHRH